MIRGSRCAIGGLGSLRRAERGGGIEFINKNFSDADKNARAVLSRHFLRLCIGEVEVIMTMCCSKV